MNKKVGKILTAAAAGAAVGVAVKKLQDSRKEKEDERIAAIEEAVMNNRDYGDRKAYLVGGGLATLAVAAYLIRDCRFPANQITVYEGMHILGGSNDGIGTPEQGFVCRGGRMLNEETYENFWELFSSIPSIRQPGRSVTEEILNFDHAHPTCAKARLVDRDGKIQDVKSMGFNQADRNALLKLLLTDEKKLDNLTIQDWFKETPHMFTTNFWHMWQTTFAFQKWSSLYEFRRYMNRMIFEFSRIETLEGVTRTPLNQYDSVIRPLEAYLRSHGVVFKENTEVTDIDFADGAGITIGGNFTENVGANLFWLRAENDNTNGYGKWHDDQNNAMDFVGLTLPLTFDGVKITPWGMYGFVGSRSLGGDAKGDIDDMRAGMLPVLPSGSDLTTLEGNRSEGNAWWVGITGEMTTFSPFRLAGDFNYGSVDMGTVRSLSGYDGATSKTIDLKRSGWLASAIAEYKLDFGVPGLLLWYGSGDNSNPYDGSERMPTVDAGWSGSSFGFDGGYGISSDTILGTSPVGTWGVALRMKDISFMENLTHAIQVGYYRGTNNKNMPANAGMTTFHASYPDATGSMVGSTYLTTKDGAWEATFDTDYQIYKDLTLAVEVGYINLDLDENVWGKGVVDSYRENNVRGAVTLQYTF